MEKVRRTPAKLSALVAACGLEVLYRSTKYDETVISVADLNRPALQLVGFFDYFDEKRLQVLGMAEMQFLQRMTEHERREVFDRFFTYHIPALIVARNMGVFPELLESARKHDRTVLRTGLDTVSVTSQAIDYLNRALAPQITRHGVLMNIYGQGVLLLGDCGVGKSETAIELLKRGHRLVADDAVDIWRVSDSIYGTAPELIRHYIEIRGIGVIDVKQLFGMGAVQFETEIDLVIQLEQWQDGKFYDRLGLGEEKHTILDVPLPFLTIPVRPGRNLAGIVEIATMKNRQMRYHVNSGMDFAQQFDARIDAMTKEGSAEA